MLRRKTLRIRDPLYWFGGKKIGEYNAQAKPFFTENREKEKGDMRSFTLQISQANWKKII